MGGTTLDLLLSADDERGVVVFPGSAKPQPQLSVTLAGEDKPIVIDASATDWQVLDESAPDAAVGTPQLKVNIQKERFMAVVRGDDGRHRWTLMRFPLATWPAKPRSRRGSA